MAKEDRKYVILTIKDVEDVDFDQVLEDSPRTLIISKDGQYTFVKFEGSTPSFLDGKTQYTNAQILAILNDEEGEWYTEDE